MAYYLVYLINTLIHIYTPISSIYLQTFLMYKIVHQQDQHDIFNKLYFNSKVFKTRQLHNNNLLNIKRSKNKF